MGLFSSLFGGGSTGGKKSKSPAYARPSDPVSALNNFSAFGALTPWRESAGTAATGAANRLGGAPSGLLAMLQQRAKEGMAAGGDLSTEEIRAATQGGRAAAQVRGMGRSPGGILTEILARAQYGKARRNEREQFAGNVLGMEQQQQQIDTGTLGAATGSVLGTYALPETIRQFDTTRDDTLTFNENNWNKDIWTAKNNAQAAQQSGQQSAAGSIGGAVVGGLLSFL